MREKVKSYRKEQLPIYLERLKSMVLKNFEIITKEVDSVITEDKYYNVLKGRRTAAEESVIGMRKVDSIYKEIENLSEEEDSSYYTEMLPQLIENLKRMYLLNLEVIDIDLDINDGDSEMLESISDELKDIFGSEQAKTIIKHANRDNTVSEDKLHNVVKSRKTAYEDCDWALSKIDELSDTSTAKEEKKKSWAKRSASYSK